MAGRMKLLAMALLLAMIALGCSSEGDDETLELEPAESSTTTTKATTTSTVATSTTLSERAQAEADVAQLVTDYWLTNIDTSTGAMGQQYLTGLIAQRTEEVVESFTAEGRILRSQGQQRIEVLEVDINLEGGTGELKTCGGSASEVVDAETLERIGAAADPKRLTTSRYLVEQTSDGWKINDYFPSNNSASPEFCEIGS